LVRLPGGNDDLEPLLVGTISRVTAAGTLETRSPATAMPASTVADLSELLVMEAEAARAERSPCPPEAPRVEDLRGS
jgi:hypothetical protein